MIQIAVGLFMFFAGSPLAFAGPLHDAARDGDLERVRALIDEGAVIDAQSERGETPLTLAILAGQGKVVEFLVDEGAAIDGRNAGGFTPLHAAAYAGDAAIAELLIERGADINDAQNKAGVTPPFSSDRGGPQGGGRAADHQGRRPQLEGASWPDAADTCPLQRS